MPAAALIGAAASIGGGLLASRATGKASRRAANISRETSATNNALQRDIYGQNKQLLSPYVNAGIPATGAINSLLGLTQDAPQAAPQAQAAPQGGMDSGTPFGGSYGGFDRMDGGERPFSSGDRFGAGFGGQNFSAQQYGAPQPVQGQVQATAAPQPSARSAFDNYLNSTGYRFRLNEGMDAINTGYAARGTLQSGAAMKALQSYGQNMASDEFGKYLGQLGNQQAMGMSAASATAGVGQNYANQTSANNLSAGQTAAQAAIMRGAGQANAWAGAAQGIGNALSSYGGRRFGDGLGGVPPGFG